MATPLPDLRDSADLRASVPSRVSVLEGLLRERKLDRTLTTVRPPADGPAPAPLEVAALDGPLGGGFPRGQLSEVVGPLSSGRTSVVWAWLAAATRRGEAAALVDTFDRFDPASGAACGIDLARLLWVRGQAVSKTAGALDPAWRPGVRAVTGPGTLLERTLDRALKALNLVLQAGVCTAVVLDVGDVPLAGLRRVPAPTWLRVQRLVAGSETTCLLLAPVPIARSAGGITVNLDASPEPRPGASPEADRRASLERSREASPERSRGANPESRTPSPEPRRRTIWAGDHDRARRLAGLAVRASLVSPRRQATGRAAVDTGLAEW